MTSPLDNTSDKIKEAGFTLLKMVGDGHCGYKAIATVLFGSTQHFQHVRSTLAEVYKNTENHSIAQHVAGNRLLEDKDVSVLAQVFNCQIIIYQVLKNELTGLVYTKDNVYVDVPSATEMDVNTVCLLHANNHFDLLVPTHIYETMPMIAYNMFDERMARLDRMQNKLLANKNVQERIKLQQSMTEELFSLLLDSNKITHRIINAEIELQSMVASLSDENIKLQERITTLEATTDQRIKDLENKNQELQSMNDSLVGNYNDRSSKEEELQQTITVLEEKQKAAQKEKETLRSSIKSYRRWTHQMRELLSQLDGVDEYEDTVDDDDDDQVEPLPKRQKR